METRVRHSSQAYSVTPGEAGGVGPSTFGDDDSAGAPVVPDDIDAAIPDAVDSADAPTPDDAGGVGSSTTGDDDPADAPVTPDDADPVISGADAPICDGNQVTPGADALMIPDADAPIVPDADGPAVPGDASRESGWHLRALLGLLIIMFPSSETRHWSFSMWAKSTHVAGRSAPDAPLSRVLSKVSPTLGLSLVLVIS